MAERPTLQSIGVCALIALHSDPTSPLHNGDEIEIGPQIHDGLTTFLEESTLGKYSRPTNDLIGWLNTLRRRVGSDAVVRLLEDTLVMAAESVDSLVDLMESLRAAIADGVVDPTSAHGVYLRSCILGFDELSFESVTLFWQDLKGQADRVEEEGNADVVENAEAGAADGNRIAWPLSTEQTERRLQADCIELALGSIASDDDHATDQSFESIELKIRQILSNNPDLPAAYFLRFLNCLRNGERSGALDSLHLYFDHALQHNAQPKDILQFSAILLAMTHNTFGDNRLALAATDEAVRVAQQSKDAACVAFALGWLFENSDYQDAERRELLKRCAKRASQGQLRSLVTGANLALATNNNDNNNANATSSWMSLMEVTAEPGADNLSTLDRPTLLTYVPEDTMESVARQHLVAAGIWDSFGIPALSELSSVSGLKNREYLSSVDIVAAIQNISRLALYGNTTTIDINIDQSKKDEKGFFSADRTTDNSPSSCIYSIAISRLVLLRESMGLTGKTHEDSFLRNMALILHEWAVNRGDLHDASALQTVFNSYCHPGIDSYDQYIVDIGLQTCLYHCRKSNWEEARKIATNLSQACATKGMKIQQCRLCVQLAIIQLESNPKQFMAALPPLLEALSLAEKIEVHGLHAAALTILARIYLRLNKPMRALGILKASVPTLLERDHIWFQAEAFLIQSKCHLELGIAGKKSSPTTSLNMRRLNASLTSLTRSQQLFERCHDFYRLREVFYLQARTHSLLDQPSEREVAANAFLQVSDYVERRGGKPAPSNVLDSLQDPSKLHALVGRTVKATA